MPQSRSRRISVAAAGGDSRSQPRATGTKPSCKIANKPHRDSSKVTGKIPKSVRFDLEKALVGLCNVWFEDIKPHLLRNNIKLHVHGDSEDSGDASTVEDAPAQACSHLDPEYEWLQCQQPRGVSFADYCTTLRKALKERSRKPPAASPRPHRRLLSVLHSQPTTTNRTPTCESPADPVQARARLLPHQLAAPSGARAPRPARLKDSSPLLAAVPECPPQAQARAPQSLMKLLPPTIIHKPVRLKKKRRPNVSDKATQTDDIPLVPPLRFHRRQERTRPRHKNANPKRKPGNPRPNPGARRNMEGHAKQTESDPLFQNEYVDLESEANHHFLRLILKKSETKAVASVVDHGPRLKKRKPTRKRPRWR